MKNSILATFVVSILIGGALGCQAPPDRIHGNINIAPTSIRSAKFNPPLKGDPSQLTDDDDILVEVVYLGYNQSPATVDKVYIGASLSTSSMTVTDPNNKTLPPQKELISSYPESTKVFPDGTKGVTFTMRFPWSDIRDDLAYINSDITNPFFFNWHFTPENGKTSDLYSVNLSDRLKNSMKYSASSNPDIIASVNQVGSDIKSYAQGDLAKELQALFVTDGYATKYPMVALDSSNSDGKSFYYIGIKVSAASLPPLLLQPPFPTSKEAL